MTTLVIGSSREIVLDYLKKVGGAYSKVNNMQLTLTTKDTKYTGFVFDINWKAKLSGVNFSEAIFLDESYPDSFINYINSKRRG